VTIFGKDQYGVFGWHSNVWLNYGESQETFGMGVWGVMTQPTILEED